MSVPLRITTYYKDEPHAVVAGIAVGGPKGTHIDIVRFNRGIYESNKKKCEDFVRDLVKSVAETVAAESGGKTVVDEPGVPVPPPPSTN